MDKPNKHKNSFLKFLPKAASAVSFHNPPFSPGRDHHHHHSSTKLKSHAYKGFSGPINFAVLPDEARRKPKNGGYDSQEPTSPKISCMGQIKCKHKKKKLLKTTKKHDHHGNTKTKEVKKSSSSISKFLSMRSPKPDKKSSNGSHASEHGKVGKVGVPDNNGNTSKIKGVPSLGQMRKFASGRETLGNFDWTAQITPIDHDRDCFSDEERRRDSDDGEVEEKEVIIPFSAPILLGGRRGGDNNSCLKPRTEVNLWKRRTMDPPPPLALKS